MEMDTTVHNRDNKRTLNYYCGNTKSIWVEGVDIKIKLSKPDCDLLFKKKFNNELNVV